MKRKKYFIFLLTLLCMLILNVSAVFASSLEDLSNGQTTPSTSEQPASAVADYLRGREAVTAENMAEAQTYVSPITNIIGTLIGVILAIASAAIFLVTALDLLYIGVPFVRPLLYPAGQQAGGAPMGGGMPMGGMGMGRMGMGGMAMGGMQGAQAMASGNSRRFVSDEAIAAVALAQPTSAQAPMMSSGMGMGGMGMMGGGMMGGGAPAAMPTKSVIVEYLKKRTIFIIVFAICSVVLFSSVLTDCGINVGLLFLKLIGKVSDAATTVNM